MLILKRLLALVAAIALVVFLLLYPAPWRPERILHGIVVSSDFGRAGRWTAGSRALIVVKLADGTRVECATDAMVLPRNGDVIRLRQRVGLFGQTLELRPILAGVPPTE